MSLPKPLSAVLAALVLGLVPLLGGCTLTPAYGTHGALTQGALAFNYAAPQTRLEQIAYQALAARMPRAQAATAPALAATVSLSRTRIGLSAVTSPLETYQVVATLTVTITAPGGEPVTERRTATAGYQTTGQIIADDTARTAAEERAVEAAAETMHLALLARFATP